MTGFISKAACKGRRPQQFVGYTGFQRQDLINRLLKERGVVRFIVAPSGYGKTSLAIEYAETVFSWIHTFFVNCQSPCFIRDLDDDSIAEACIALDDKLRLVVFDALPPLDTGRAERFSKEMDALLSAGCEVLVTCTPSANRYGQLQGDQVRLGAQDLLLSDYELDDARAGGDRARTTSESLSAAYRVPALAWGSGSTATVGFLKSSFQEPMPSDVLFVMVSMYVLQQGVYNELERIGSIDLANVGAVLGDYPHLCFDEEQGTFDAPRISMDDLSRALKGLIGSLVDRSPFSSREELVVAWADLLLQSGVGAERACDVVRCICPRPLRSRWAADHALDLVHAGCFYPSIRLLGASSTKSAESMLWQKATVNVLGAVSCMVLGDAAGSAMRARRVAFDENAPSDLQAYGLIVLARVGDAQAKQRAEEMLVQRVVGAAHMQAGQTLEEALVLAWGAARNGVDALGALWGKLQMAGASDDVLCIAASWLFGLVEAQLGDESPDEHAITSEDVARAERFVRARIERSETGASDYFTISAALSLESAHVKGMGLSAGPLPTAVLLDLRRFEVAIRDQRRRLAHDVAAEKARRSNWVAPKEVHSSLEPAELVPRMQRNVPILELKMFGRFDAAIGGVALDPALFHRQNVRSLLVLLAINQGRELSRELVESTMWPRTSPDIARKNFYSVWSQLKQSLTLPDGTCPYLVRHQYGCSLEQRYVQSDVTRLSQICRELLFGNPDPQEWASMYAELDRDFSNELLPSEKNNPLVAAARNDFRLKLVDALVAASQSIVETGNPQWGIWFSRMALKHDKTREDAYVALMKAQIASDQRTAAMMTYLTCQRVLAEELGVDPSPETRALYESLLD